MEGVSQSHDVPPKPKVPVEVKHREKLENAKAKVARDMTGVKVDIEREKKEMEKKEKSPEEKLIAEKNLVALRKQQSDLQFDWRTAARALEDFEKKDASQKLN
jgi:hypothetical protein